MRIPIPWISTAFVVVYTSFMLNLLLWVWTGGAYVLDNESVGAARLYSGLKQVLLFSMTALLAVMPRTRSNLMAAWPMVALLTYQVASVSWSLFPVDALRGLGWFLMQVLLGIYLTRRNFEQAIDELNVVSIVLSALNVVALIAFPQIVWEAGGWGGVYVGAFVGIFGNKNLFGAVAVPCALVSLAVLANGQWRGRWPTKLAVATWCGLVLISKSATSMTALAVTVAVFFGVQSGMARLRSGERLFVLVSVATAAALIAAFWDDILGLLTGGLGRDLTLTGRTYIWEFVLRASGQRWLFGAGAGSFWLPFLADKSLLNSLGLFYIASAHNGFLESYANGGVLELGLNVAVFVVAALRTLPLVLNQRQRTLAGFCAAAIVMTILQNTTESIFPIPYYLNGTLLTIVLVLSARRLPAGSAVGRPTHAFTPQPRQLSPG